MRAFLDSKIYRLILACFILAGAPPLFAGSFTAEIDKTQSSLDEPFWLTVAIQGSLSGDVEVPQSADLEIVRTGESTNISIINGSMTKERQYTYQVRALKEGSLTIPALKARVDGEDLKTAPIQVVVKGGVAPPSGNDISDNKKLVLVERELPKVNLYEGEALISTVRLLNRARLTGATPNRDSAPDWRRIGVDGQRNTEVTRDGMRWNAIEMREGLIPLKSGRLKVPAFGITATWLQPSSRKQRRSPSSVFDLFQQGVFNMGEEVTRKLLSDPMEVDVKALPLPKPQSFADIVGAFNVKSSVSKREISAGDTVTVTIEVQGQGALDRMRDVKLSLPGVKVYADRPDLKEKVEPGAGLVSTRILKFAVVPAAGGLLDLGSVKFSSFNPFTEQYEELSANLGKLSVQGTVSPNSPSQSTPAPETASLEESKSEDTTRSPILTPRIVENSGEADRNFWFAPWALALEFLLVAGVLAWLWIRRGIKRYIPAKVITESSYEKWQDLLSAIDRGEPSALDRSIDQLRIEFARPGQDPKAMTSAELVQNAKSFGLEPSVVESLRRILEEIDRQQYGLDPNVSVSPSMLSDVRSVILSCIARGQA